MLVRHFMSPSVETLPSTMACSAAWDFLARKGLRRAPVMKSHHVLGMICESDLLRVLPWSVGQLSDTSGERDGRRPIRDLLKRELIAVAPNAHLEAAAKLMLQHKIGGLPVMDGEQLVGIITESDIFRTFVTLKSSAKGTRLSLHWPKSGGGRADPGRIALATGVQFHEHTEHPSPGEGLLLGLRVEGERVDAFVQRMLDSGYLLLDREEPPGV